MWEESSGNATFDPSQQQAYEGSSWSARARFQGSPQPQSSRAYGEFKVDAPDGFRGVYAAALYFSPGTLTGPNPTQRADIDVMRWGGGTEFGGIRIGGSDHRARLVRGSQAGSGGPEVVETIGDSFRLQEGCWNWLAVDQKLSSKPADDPGHAINEVTLNGRKIIRSFAPNKLISTSKADFIRFGMPYIDQATQGNRTVQYYVDNAFVSNGRVPPPGATACAPAKPNVLIFLTDDQRADDTMQAMPKTTKWFRTGSTAGGDVVDGGMEFSEGYTTTPVCCPSRSSILSGRFAHNHAVRNNDESANLDQNLALPRYLKDEGYKTGVIGKFLNDWNTYLPPPHFDKYWIFNANYNAYANNNGAIETTPYSTSYVRDKALEFLDESESQDDEPWFLYVTPFGPHEDGEFPYPNMHEPAYGPGNYDPPPPPPVPSRNEGTAPGADPISDKPQWVQNWDDNRSIFAGSDPAGGPLRDQQLRALRSVDDMIEAVFQRLKGTGEERDTIAFFLSDNGYMWREHGMASNETGPNSCTAVGSGCGLTTKAMPYTESIKVPFFMRWPASSRVYRNFLDRYRTVANIDVAPTVINAVAPAAAPSEPMDGLSLLDPTQARTKLLTEAWGTGGRSAATWAALRTKDFHYIEYFRADGVTPRQDTGGVVREYYDLRVDPYQLTNLLRDGDPNSPDPAMIDDLSTQLRKERLCSGSSCSPGVATETADTKPPKLRVNTPKPDALVNGLVHFAADASDNIGVHSIEFYEGSNLLGIDTLSPLETTWDTSSLPTGTYDLRAVAKDDAGNSDTVDFQVKVGPFDIQSANSPEAGSTPGHIEAGDTLTYFFDQPVTGSEIIPGWDGLPRSSVAQLAPDDPFQGYNDTLAIDEAPALGVVNLGRPDYWGWREPIPVNGEHIVFMDLAADGRSLTLEFGAGTQTGFPLNGGTMVWTPSPSLCSAAPVCRVTESGPTADVDF